MWFYFEGNDLRNLVSEQHSTVLSKYLNNHHFSQQLIKRQAEIDQLLIDQFNQEISNQKSELERWITRLNNLIQGILKLKRLRERLTLFNPPPLPSPLFKQVLKTAKDLTTSWGTKFYFIYLPAWERYVDEVDHPVFFHRNQVLSIISDLEIPIIDMHDEVFANHPDPISLFPFKLKGHYTAEGYHLVTQAIYKHLHKNNN